MSFIGAMTTKIRRRLCAFLAFKNNKDSRKAEPPSDEHEKLANPLNEEEAPAKKTNHAVPWVEGRTDSISRSDVMALEKPWVPPKEPCKSALSNLPPDLKRRVADFLISRDLYRLAMTNRRIHGDLNLKTKVLSPYRLLRNMSTKVRGGRVAFLAPQKPQFVQDIPIHATGMHSNDDVMDHTHSIHAYCKWILDSVPWFSHDDASDNVLVELYVVKQHQFPPYRVFEGGHVVAKSVARTVTPEADHKKAYVTTALSFQPKRDGSRYQLWCRHFHRQIRNAGYGELSLFATVYHD